MISFGHDVRFALCRQRMILATGWMEATAKTSVNLSAHAVIFRMVKALIIGTLAALLSNTVSYDSLTYVSIFAVLLIAAFLATLLPARRATGIQPLEALRYE